MFKKQAGFTLIELVMVIVLLGILAAIAVPKFADIQDQAKDAVLEASIGALKSAAIIQYAKNRGVAVSFVSIRAETDLDPVVEYTTPQCSNGLLTYAGSSRTKSFSISTTYCSP